MKRSKKKTLKLKKFIIAKVGNPEKINGGGDGDGGWTRVKDKEGLS